MTRFLPLADQRLFFPPPTWHIDGWIPARQHTIMFGGKGSLKTFIALDIVYATATGLPTLFGPAPVRKGPAIYFSYAGEGIEGIRHNRTLAWEIAHRLDGPHPDFILLPGPRLMKHHPEDLVREIKEGLAGEDCALICVDTIFQATSGLLLVESGSTYSRFADTLMGELGAAVLSLHHPPKDNKTREQRGKGEKPTPFGAMDLTANTASLLYVERTGPATTSIEQLYHKDSAENEAVTHLKIEKIDTADSLVLRQMSAPQARFETDLQQIVSRPVVWGALAAFGHPVETETLANALTRPGANKAGRQAEIFATLTRAKRKGGALELYCMDGYWRLPSAD